MMRNKGLNLSFALIPMGLILFGLWGLYNNVNVPARASSADWELLGQLVMGIAGVMLLLSPILFRDTWPEMGCGGPGQIKRFFRETPAVRKRTILLVFIAVNVAVVAAYFSEARGILEWGFMGVGAQLGLRKAPAAMLWFPLVSINVTFSFVMRYDNLKKALPGFLLSLVLGYVFLAILTSIIDARFSPDEAVWQRWDTGRYLKGVMGRYILWGTLQQFLFLSILNTRFRKGIGDPRLSALLTGLCFGAIHAPIWPLSALTFIGGTLWAWFFQKNPNLVVAGFVHGCLGTFISIMIADPWVPMQVGPIGL